MKLEDHRLRETVACEECPLPTVTSEAEVFARRGRGRRLPDAESDRPRGREAVTFPLPPRTRWGPRERARTLRLALLCVLLAVGAGAILLPAVRSAMGDGDSRDPGGMHMGGGLPPAGGQTETGTETETEIETERETLPVVIPPVGDESTDESETESDTYASDDTESESESESEAETETETRESETLPPDGYAVVRKDLSEPERSVGYIQSTANSLPPSIPGEGTRLWSTASAPTVLVVHSHPYEGYHDGGDWYDPATGPFAQTDATGTSEGVVALGAELSGILREAGVNVIHLRVPVGDGESTSAIYARTEEAVRYYCEMYPDIGLVIDLRRSAELTDQGEILRTAGSYGGEDCAQVRLSVSGDRATDTVSRDIAVAVALRRALWAEEPSISRPVLVKGGSGMAGELDRVVMLTVELGSAGNSFSEAQRLLMPLGEAIAALVQAP